jgi:hypothetical protein
MKLPADSLALVIANLLFLGLFLLLKRTHVGCCTLGSPANVFAAVIVPSVLLISVYFLIQDLVGRITRKQAVLALVVSIPAVVILFSMKP